MRVKGVRLCNTFYLFPIHLILLTSCILFYHLQISLGDGVLCSKVAYNKLVHVEESHADWACALLKGVFGDKAHRMRVRISRKYTENERFPTNFLMVAKCK